MLLELSQFQNGSDSKQMVQGTTTTLFVPFSFVLLQLIVFCLGHFGLVVARSVIE